MTIIDISVPISSTLPLYPGDPPMSITRAADLANGDSLTLSRLAFGVHTGTHVDAPLHFIAGGKTVDMLDLDVLIGPAFVLQLHNSESTISASDLEAAKLPPGTERVLLKTRNSQLWAKPGFQRDFSYPQEDAAAWLIDHGVRLVGIDYLSIEKFGSTDFPVHMRLLGAGVVILEGVNLTSVEAGPYKLVCLPIKLMGAEGAPARAVLIQE